VQTNQTEVQTVELAVLESHPWQLNVPNLTGKDWNIFYKDVSKRGIQEPISVSTRTGKPVIVDGHQRVRAARELGLTHVSAIVRTFADEGEEVTFLAGAARFRRHLNDFQRVEIGKAYETYFRPKAKEAQKEAGKQHGRGQEKLGLNLAQAIEPIDSEESLTANLPQAIGPEPAEARKTATKAAEAVGMSPAQYKKAKQVSDKAPEPVKKEWAQGQLSTHAAHELTRAPDPIRNAINDKSISPQQAVAIQRDKKLKEQVVQGQVTPVEAARLSDVMQEQLDEENRVMGRDLAFDAHTDLTRITDRSVEEWLEALNTRMNTQVWKGTLLDDLRETIKHLQTVEREAMTVTV
jgi:ParB-like chromosome segregation protein Spo0J